MNFLSTLQKNWQNIKNLVITGDFKLHVNDPEDQDREVFIDTMLVLGLDQHVTFPTHKCNNTLDLVFSECLSTHKILSCKPGPYLSDHAVVEFLVSFEKEHMVSKHITIRKLKSIDIPSFIDDLQLEDKTDPNNVDDMVEWFETRVQTALDKHAPVKEKPITVRCSNPWFTGEIKEQKRIVRRREKIWRLYGFMENWTALKIERQKYKRMLRDVKTQTICEKVADCNRDAKKFYSLMSYLTGTKVDNPMPEHTDEDQLADEFGDFFMGKIKTIHDSLAEHPIYIPHGPAKASLNQFQSVSADDMEHIIRGMPTKSCESDAIPTSMLKEILPAVTPSLAKIIKISLEHGIFAAAWKIAIIRPFLKKAGLDLISSNYRPVSNLVFLSEVLEKAVLEQFITYCDAHSRLPVGI